MDIFSRDFLKTIAYEVWLRDSDVSSSGKIMLSFLTFKNFKIHLYLQDAATAPTSNIFEGWAWTLVSYIPGYISPIVSTATAVKKGLGYFPFRSLCLSSAFFHVLHQGKLLQLIDNTTNYSVKNVWGRSTGEGHSKLISNR